MKVRKPLNIKLIPNKEYYINYNSYNPNLEKDWEVGKYISTSRTSHYFDTQWGSYFIPLEYSNGNIEEIKPEDEFIPPPNVNEIKVNKPVPTLDMFNNIKEKIYVILDTLEGADHDKLDKLYFDILMKATNGFGFDWNKLSDINKIEVYNQLKDLLSKNNSLHEIKVNRPSQIHDLDKPGNKFDNIKPGDVLQLSIPGDKGPVQQRVIGRKDDVIKTIDLVDGKEKQEAYDYWSKESLQNYYSHTHINEVKRLQQLAGINEIKITKPGIKLPIIVSEKEYLRIAPILTQQGYNWVGNKDRKVEDFNPWSLDQPMPDKIELYALGGDLLSWGTPEDLDEIKK